MPDDYLSFDDALNELQMQEAELRALVSQGKLRAFRDENTLKFRRSDVEDLRKQRETEATMVLRPDDAALATPASAETKTDLAGPAPVAEDSIDLLADEVLDYDDTAETIIGGDLGGFDGDSVLTLDDESSTAFEPEPAFAPEPGAPAEPGTKVPTIELTPADMQPGTDETAVPTLDLGDDLGVDETGSETEVPTMVLGLDEYDDTQVATEEVATEEVFIGDDELGEAPATADLEEEPVGEPGGQEEAERVVGSITGSSSFGTGEPLAAREQPSALFTVMSAIAGVMLLGPGAIFFYCMATQKVPSWGFLESIIKFFWEQFQLPAL